MDKFEQRSPQTYAFGPYLLFPERLLLLQAGQPVRIGGRALDILVALVERPGEILSKRQLMERAWPTSTVGEDNLKVNIASLRRVLDVALLPKDFIESVPGCGYRFALPVLVSTAFDGVSPAAATGQTHGSNLPTATTRIVGRTDTIDAIGRELAKARLVSIVGPGGIGKTTVALAAAEREVGRFKHGVWLVDFSPLKDVELVPNAIAMAIGVPMHTADTLATLCEFLRDHDVLLIFDNCEHMAKAIASCVCELLTAAKGMKVIATSREPLAIDMERVYRLPGLPVPPASFALGASEALAFPAVQLFVDRVSDRLESFSLNDADAMAAAEICRRLDGLALAIELAAMRVDIFGVAGVLKQLDDRFRLLAGRRAGLARHQTLAATLDWSYGLLSENEAILLRSVSVFAGLFDIDAAAAASEIPTSEAANGLQQLAAKSLLTPDLDSKGIAYRLLETTRVYCLDHLRASGDEHCVRRHHAEHILSILEKAEEDWAHASGGEWGTTYGGVIDDLRGALAWAGKDRESSRLRIRLTVAGLLLWNYFSLTEECRVQVSRAVDELEPAGLIGTPFEMQLKAWLGNSIMFTRGMMPEAIEAMRRALEIAIEIGNVDYQLRCLRMIGIYELFAGNHDEGMIALEACISLAAAGDPSALPECESHIAIAELFLGKLRSARQRLESLQQHDRKSVPDLRRLRYQSNRSIDVACVLSQVQWLTGSPDTAMQMANVAVGQARAVNHHLALSTALSYACPVFYWSGDYEQCALHIEVLDDEARRHGFDVRRPVAMFFRAALACVSSTGNEAIDDIERAIALFHSTGHLARMPLYLGMQAEFLANFGRLEEAGTVALGAIDSARTQNEMWCAPELLRIQASIAKLGGHTGEAEALLAKSMVLAQETGALSWQLRSATDLAKLHVARSRVDDAHKILSPVVQRFTEGFETRDLITAINLLSSLRNPQAIR
ncbi:winged helix-turn-helix domain-containing protein [Rhizobium sp. 18055]|uniref:ATP-binding protein n=1 Tax=Rhizobium sp. 18055 TaxID=2681403 RepID=UPI00135A66DC|nr:winged helix-turn-helix domain-containing protein [Rhizobium sp. 18055]